MSEQFDVLSSMARWEQAMRREIKGEKNGLAWWADSDGLEALAEIGRLTARIAELEAEIARLKEQQRWVEVGKKLPKAGVPVWIATCQGTCCRASLSPDIGRKSFLWKEQGSARYWLARSVTHWMPATDMPDQESEDSKKVGEHE